MSVSPYGATGSGFLQEVSNVLIDTPLASARDIAGMLGRSLTMVYRALRSLRDEGLVESVSLSWYLDSVQRWRFTPKGLRDLFGHRLSWHDEWALCRLLDRLASLEAFYQVAGWMQDMGRLIDFQWLEGLGIDAAVRYEGGWVALMWSGHLHSEEVICERLERFSREIDSVAVLDEMAWPGMFCFAVSDPWQGELVRRAVRQYGLGDNSAIWCVSDRSCTAADELRPSRGWILQYPPERDLGGWSWDDRIRSSFLSERDSLVITQVLDLVLQWPGVSVRMLRGMLRENSWGRRVQVALKSLLDREMVHREASGREYRYFVTSRGLDFLARRDRVNFSRLRRRGEGLSWLLRKDRRPHEDGIMLAASACGEHDIPMAPGWRSWEHLGHASIVPDSMVHLARSPYGPGWYYFEYERSARGVSRVSRKLRGYGSRNRQDDWPVLVGCWNDRSEAVFQEVGSQLGLRMLTTTVDRLGSCPVVGEGGCWSRYGRPAVIG